MAVNTFTYSGTTLEFTQASSDGSGMSIEKYQVTGRDSGGNYYQYKKSTITSEIFTLSFACQDRIKVNEAMTFFEDVVDGMRNDVQWTDHNNDTRTVRFKENSLQWDKTNPNEYTMSFSVEAQ